MENLEQLELKISKFLRFGVILAGALMLIGFVLGFYPEANPFLHFSQYDELPFKEIVSLHFKRRHFGPLISYTGLIILILLPVIRVFLTGILFLRAGEKIMSLLAIIVLMALLISFSFGIDL